jgi:hypothetical protein
MRAAAFDQRLALPQCAPLSGPRSHPLTPPDTGPPLSGSGSRWGRAGARHRRQAGWAPGRPRAGPGRAGWGGTGPAGPGRLRRAALCRARRGPGRARTRSPCSRAAGCATWQRSCAPAVWPRASAFWSDGRKGRQAGGRAPGRLAGGRAARGAEYAPWPGPEQASP